MENNGGRISAVWGVRLYSVSDSKSGSSANDGRERDRPTESDGKEMRENERLILRETNKVRGERAAT